MTDLDGLVERVILASASPRRQELLRLVISDFDVVPSAFDESQVAENLAPADHVLYSSQMKARDVAERYPDSLVIAADTVVVIDGKILGKPADRSDAARMLRMLGGRTHEVYTGVTVRKGQTERSGSECTCVTFRELADEMVSRYVSSGEPLDKAGAYAIQGRGTVLVSSIEGCYFNVVGLPLFRLSVLLEDFGVEVLADA